jgi:hypothetical protein
MIFNGNRMPDKMLKSHQLLVFGQKLARSGR